jgi:magnesium transporter
MVDGDEELKEADDRSSGAPDPEDEAEEDGYTLDRRTIAAILFAVDANDRDKLVDLMEPLHAADIADLLEQINAYDRRRLIQLYDREFDGEILSELGESIREEVIRALNPDVLADAVRELDSDDVVDLVEDLEEPQQEAILDVLEDSDRAAVEQALAYPEESAGRLMQREVVAVPEFWNVGQAIDYMRERDDLPEQFYHVILVDPRFKPVGHVTLGKLMASRRVTQLSDITEPGFRTFEATEDEGDIAYAFNQYHLISGPVVDENDRLVGVITIDDAMIVLDEEHDEDILRLAGVSEESALTDTVVDTTKRRFPWLAVNLVTAILASLVIAQFEDTIAQFVALAVLMPIVASMGGNAGTQSLTVAVRSIATKDLTGANVWRVIRRECLVGLVNGVIFAVVMGIVGLIWFGSPALGYVIAAAMVINLVVAGLAGTVIPVVLDRVGVDPALASGAFVTTVTDIVGFFAFLGLAGVILL